MRHVNDRPGCGTISVARYRVRHRPKKSMSQIVASAKRASRKAMIVARRGKRSYILRARHVDVGRDISRIDLTVQRNRLRCKPFLTLRRWRSSVARRQGNSSEKARREYGRNETRGTQSRSMGDELRIGAI
jgi:hypothetical protein